MHLPTAIGINPLLIITEATTVSYNSWALVSKKVLKSLYTFKSSKSKSSKSSKTSKSKSKPHPQNQKIFETQEIDIDGIYGMPEEIIEDFEVSVLDFLKHNLTIVEVNGMCIIWTSYSGKRP